MSETKAQFTRLFERTYAQAKLPEVYRRFISSEAYLELKTCFVQGLTGMGPTFAEIQLDDERLLDIAEMFDERDISLDRFSEIHPIGTIRYGDNFLAIDTTNEHAPVFCWRGDDGAFHPEFDTFEEFLDAARRAP